MFCWSAPPVYMIGSDYIPSNCECLGTKTCQFLRPNGHFVDMSRAVTVPLSLAYHLFSLSYILHAIYNET